MYQYVNIFSSLGSIEFCAAVLGVKTTSISPHTGICFYPWTACRLFCCCIVLYSAGCLWHACRVVISSHQMDFAQCNKVVSFYKVHGWMRKAYGRRYDVVAIVRFNVWKFMHYCTYNLVALTGRYILLVLCWFDLIFMTFGNLKTILRTSFRDHIWNIFSWQTI